MLFDDFTRSGDEFQRVGTATEKHECQENRYEGSPEEIV